MNTNDVLSQFLTDESGQAITEYGAILAFVALIVALVFSLTSGSVRCALENAFSVIVFQLNNISSASS